MNPRRLLALAPCLLFALPALASPSGVVISGFQVRGPNGGNDEYVELRNTATASVDISGWKLQGCQSGSPGTAGTRATIGSVTLASGQYYLFTNSGSSGYSGSVSGDQTYSTGFSDFSASNYSGIQLVDGNGAIQDAVGAPQSPCAEGTGLITPTANGAGDAYARVQDSGDNAADFAGPQASAPHNSGGGTGTPCANDGLHIYTIQGRGHVSPYNGQCVSGVPGIVTQVVANGFYLQDGDGDGDTATSDGIFVFTSTAPTVSAGQELKVAGTVSEFRPGSSFGATNCPTSSGACNLTVTEISGATVTPASGLFANTIIKPVIIGAAGRVPPDVIIDNDTSGSVEVAAQTTYDPDQDGIDFYESLEGMQVEIDNARVVGPTDAYGEIWVLGDNGTGASGVNARGGITLRDLGAAGGASGGADGVDYNPERVQIDLSLLTSDYPQASVGDTTPQIVGALSYDYGNYRVFPQTLPSFTSASLPRTSSTVSSGDDRLRIASYNVENLDPNDNDTCDGGPDQDIANGRFAREAQQIVANLGSPDVIGIEELQDNSGCDDDGTVAASTTLATLLQAIASAGGPSYAYTEIDPANDADGGIPGGNIRQAILYNPARVTLVPGTSGAGDATTATALSADAQGRLQLSYSPGRIEPADAAWTDSRKPLAATFDFNGQRVLVIVNHFNSKGGDEPLFGRYQPPVLGSAVQRTQQAQIEHDFVQQALALDPSARVVALGDFNDFDFSAPMRTLTGASAGTPILTDLSTALLPAEERYSYVYQGNAQELDHLYVTAALLPAAEVQPIHINAEYADQVSDHDPLIASLQIQKPASTNQPPVADAGGDSGVRRFLKATLDGSGSHDADGRITAYRWTQTGGPKVRLNGAATATPSFRAWAGAGTVYRFQLTVTDDGGAQSTATVAVTVQPWFGGGQ
jgi:predicted extracellular nuclease